jgi:deazaflavin-dependent oxidoreductase (nitroreductase family)
MGSIIWRVTRLLTRPTNVVMRRLGGTRFLPAWGVVRVPGRRSGRMRETPVQVRRRGDEFVISLPWGERSDWVRNVLAAGRCTIRWRGREVPATQPQIIGWEGGADAFGPAVRAVLWLIRTRTFVRLRIEDE